MNTIFQHEGRPFFVLGGQAHNSTTGNPRDLAQFWQALDALNANTAEIPVYWEHIEPTEGCFDFSCIDLLFAQARERSKKLVLLWFGTWKNGNMRYVPAWVKQDTTRFGRVVSQDGNQLFVLSSHCKNNLQADKKAFCALMAYLKTVNTDGTLLSVQVENEPGIAGRSYRDFSPEAEADFQTAVPHCLLQILEETPDSPLARQWQQMGSPQNANWGESFGVKNGAENLTAYSIAGYINEIARAGKEAYPLPLYVNVALDGNPWGWNLPGTNYTAGGPIPRLYEIWKLAAPDIDLLAPDIYFDSTSVYTAVCSRYNNPQNALFVPESGCGPQNLNYKNMYYAAGTYGAIGLAAFGIEDILTPEGIVKDSCRNIVSTFRSFSQALPLLTKYRHTGKIHTVVQEEGEGGFFFETKKHIVKVDYSKDINSNFIHRALAPSPGRARGLIIEAAPDEFFFLGSDFTVYFAPKDDIFYSEDRVSNHMPYLFIEEGYFDRQETWQPLRTRTGDECDHGVWVFEENQVVHITLCP